MSTSRFSEENAYRAELTTKLKVDAAAFTALCITAGLTVGFRSELIGLNIIILYAVVYIQPSWAERFCFLGTAIQVMVGEPMVWAAVAQPALFFVQGIGRLIKIRYRRPRRYVPEELADSDTQPLPLHEDA